MLQTSKPVCQRGNDETKSGLVSFREENLTAKQFKLTRIKYMYYLTLSRLDKWKKLFEIGRQTDVYFKH